MKPEILRLYAVTDRTWLGGKSLAWQVEQAIKGGATCVQLREKGKAKEEIINSAREVKAVCNKYGVPLIINDSPELAALCDADGVHIGQGDGSVAEARRIIGKDRILGVSARTIDAARKAEAEGADYIGTGAAFQTSTKGDAEVITTDRIREITGGVRIPVTAIGGINENNLMRLKGTGISGAAIVSGIFAQEDIEAACRRLRKMTDSLKYKITGAIFDLDGTLFDSMHIWEELAVSYIVRKGLVPKPNLYENVKTMSFEDAARYLKYEYKISETQEDMEGELKLVLSELYNKSAELKTGVAEFLKYLKEQGVKICIATASDGEITERILKKYDVLKYIDKIFTCNEYGHKDGPEIYNAALEYMETDLENTWVFEDAAYCIRTAKNAGFNVCAVWDKYETDVYFVKENSDLYLETFERAEIYFD